MSTSERTVETGISLEELQLATRNHGMPLEALRWEVTPVGLHYLLAHFDIPAVEASTWRLTVDGLVANPRSFSLAELRAMPSVDLPVTMECAGNGRARLQPRPISQPWLAEAIGTGLWTGTPLRGVLGDAGVRDDAVEVLFTGLDHGLEGGIEQDYARSLSIADAMREEVLLVWALNGQPLPPQHGFPLRLIVPGWYGMTSVKWLGRITAIAEPFQGYQQANGYRYRSEPDEVGEPVQRIVPRAMMVPPGHPEFMTRSRRVRPGPCRLEGRAWSGRGAITRVDVSVDGGATWQPADLGEPPSPYAWAPWTFTWDATRGEHEVCCRATDETGATQPDEPSWNVGGYSNNAIQRVAVVVEGD